MYYKFLRACMLQETTTTHGLCPCHTWNVPSYHEHNLQSRAGNEPQPARALQGTACPPTQGVCGHREVCRFVKSCLRIKDLIPTELKSEWQHSASELITGMPCKLSSKPWGRLSYCWAHTSLRAAKLVCRTQTKQQNCHAYTAIWKWLLCVGNQIT